MIVQTEAQAMYLIKHAHRQQLSALRILLCDDDYDSDASNDSDEIDKDSDTDDSFTDDNDNDSDDSSDSYDSNEPFFGQFIDSISRNCCNLTWLSYQKKIQCLMMLWHCFSCCFN
jgi:hypothetical protein